MTNEVTYTSLLNDDKFLDDAYYALRAQGINVSTQRKDILDRFLTNKRYFDTNIASTFVIGDEVKKMSDQDKKAYADAVTKVEQLPTIGKAGAAPTSDLIKDYLVAGVTDPTNLISILAGAFTFGAGGAAIQAGKETAKQGVKNLVKSKVKVLTQSQKNKALAKTLIAEGAIAGTGGLGQNLKAQEVDMAIGRREPGKYNVGEALAQGAIEGLASPVAGVALAGIGKAGVTGIKKVGSLATRTKSGEQAAQYVNRMKNYLLPFGGVDDITQRNFERGRAIFKDIKGETENLVDAIRIEEQRFLKADDGMNVPEKLRMTVEDKRNLVNSAMENDTAALRSLEEKDAGMYNAINDFVKLRKKVYKRVFKYTDPQSDKIQNIYKIDPEQYTKNVADRAKKDAGIPFKFWKKYEVNQADLDTLKTAVKKDKEEQVRFGLRKGTVDPATGKVTDIGELKPRFNPQREGKPDYDRQTKLVDDFIERQVYKYRYSKQKKTKFGGLKTRREINPTLRKIWGFNTSPAVRAAETIGAITEPVSEVLVADQIGKSLVGRGIAVDLSKKLTPDEKGDVAIALQKAAEERPGEDLVPLVGGPDADDAAIRLARTDIFNPELNMVFVSRDVANKLKVYSKGEASDPVM